MIGDPLAAQRNKRHEKDDKPETRVVGIESRIGAACPAGAVAARLVALSVVMRSDAVDRGWHADGPRGATSMLPAGNEPIKARRNGDEEGDFGNSVTLSAMKNPGSIAIQAGCARHALGRAIATQESTVGRTGTEEMGREPLVGLPSFGTGPCGNLPDRRAQ